MNSSQETCDPVKKQRLWSWKFWVLWSQHLARAKSMAYNLHPLYVSSLIFLLEREQKSTDLKWRWCSPSTPLYRPPPKTLSSWVLEYSSSNIGPPFMTSLQKKKNHETIDSMALRTMMNLTTGSTCLGTAHLTVGAEKMKVQWTHKIDKLRASL